MSDWSAKKTVRRGLLYLGIALGALALMGLVVALSAKTGITIPARWIALAMWTVLLFWLAVKQSREHWRRPAFWCAISGLLAIHLLAFIAALRRYPQWREVWFIPIVIVEAGLFSVVLDFLLGSRPRRSHHLHG